MKEILRLGISLLATASLAACTGSSPVTPPPDAEADAGTDGGAEGPLARLYCDRGQSVPGATAPAGFCLKHYAQVGEARVLALAPNGDLFVGAPSTSTSGGATGGPGAIMVLSDDDHDGIAEESLFAANLIDVHAVVVGGGFVYFTTRDDVWRTPYALGQRVETPGAREGLGLPKSYGMGGRWTHGLARSAGGKLFTSRGDYGLCGNAFGGEISEIGAGGALTQLAHGLRNPMYLRCHSKDEVCAAMELGDDLRPGAHEKMIVLRSDTAYGFPCCYGPGKPSSLTSGMTCNDVTLEDAQFALAETPFGFDWERGLWPAPFKNAIFVALHGSAYSTPSWEGARIVYAAADPTTHAPVQDWQDFLGGFGPGGLVLERPSDVVFSPDGRMFFADDHGGRVYWMAPKTLEAPP